MENGKTLKQFVMDYVEQNGPCRRVDIMRQIAFVVWKRPYCHALDRGTLTSAFCDPNTYQAYLHNNYFRRPGRTDKRFLEKIGRGLYKVSYAN